jgi:hypothetical protein
VLDQLDHFLVEGERDRMFVVMRVMMIVVVVMVAHG